MRPTATTPRLSAVKPNPPVEKYNRYNQPGYNRYDQERLNKDGEKNFYFAFALT